MSRSAAELQAELRAIERRRKELALSKDSLERAADIARGHYHRLLTGHCRPRASTIVRLRLALQRSAAQQDASGGTSPHSIAYRMAIALAAGAMGKDPVTVHGQDPARRATQSPEWRAAAEVRRIAIYLLNTAIGFPQATVARAAGVTRQAVWDACRAIEQQRDDQDLDRMLTELTAAITGE